VRWLLVAVLGVALGADLVAACSDPPTDHVADHGAQVPGRAREAVDCIGKPWLQGSGNDDSGPESVQDDARTAVDGWLKEEGALLPGVHVDEAARHDRAVLFTWSEGGDRLGAFVVHQGMDGTDGHRGWGVASYAVCDPSFWPDAVAERYARSHVAPAVCLGCSTCPRWSRSRDPVRSNEAPSEPCWRACSTATARRWSTRWPV
jgi:hypothetical protein